MTADGSPNCVISTCSVCETVNRSTGEHRHDDQGGDAGDRVRLIGVAPAAGDDVAGGGGGRRGRRRAARAARSTAGTAPGPSACRRRPAAGGGVSTSCMVSIYMPRQGDVLGGLIGFQHAVKRCAWPVACGDRGGLGALPSATMRAASPRARGTMSLR